MISFAKRHKIEILLQLSLVIVAGVFLFYNANRPLVDYDEATYAKVVVDSLANDSVSSFKFFGNDWFEKPPLYLWLAMGSVKIFGVEEFAFRLPNILMSILCLWLTYLLMRELTRNRLISSATFLILLFSPPFFVFSMEARLDFGTIAGILAALLFCIKGWTDRRFLYWVLPALAIGLMFKGAMVVFALPILLIYCLIYKQWTWLKTKQLWIGSIISLGILAPWHIAQTIRFGTRFWNDYFVRQVFQRSVSTITGSNNYYDYLKVLWQYYSPWLMVIFVLFAIFLVVLFSKKLRGKIEWRDILTPLVSGFVLTVLFTMIRTHLSTYILPVFPLFAMFIGISIFYLSRFVGKHVYVPIVVVVLLLGIGIYKSFKAIPEVVPIYNSEQMKLAQFYKRVNTTVPAELYAYDWPLAETIGYYGAIRTRYIAPSKSEKQQLIGPFYLMTTTNVVRFFFKDPRTPLPGYENMQLLFVGDYFVLIYSLEDTTLPSL